MREIIERVFEARAYEEYGSVENCVLATECEHGRMHVHPDFGFVELLRPDGTAAGRGETGRNRRDRIREIRAKSLSGIESVIWRNGLRSLVPVVGRCFRCWKQWLGARKTCSCFPTGEA